MSTPLPEIELVTNPVHLPLAGRFAWVGNKKSTIDEAREYSRALMVQHLKGHNVAIISAYLHVQKSGTKYLYWTEREIE